MMSTWRSRAAVAALCLAIAGAAPAQEPDGGEGAQESPLACSVSGYDVVIANGGTAPVAAGTDIAWSVPFARSRGEHTLADGLEPGGRVFLSGVLGSSYLTGDQPCEIAVE